MVEFKNFSHTITTSDITIMYIDLAGFSFLQVSGLDAKKFLQGQLTCDVDEITPTECRMGAHCNPDGRVISLFYLFQYEHIYYLLMPQSTVAIALAALKKYAVFYKVTLQEVNLQLAGYMGSPEHLSCHSILIKIPLPNYWLIIGEMEQIKKIANNSFISGQQFNLENKIPAIFPETSQKFLPHEINLHNLNAINFSKGCYTGQEIIARMHYRAKLKNHLYLAEIKRENALPAGSEIYYMEQETLKSCGMIVDAHQQSDHTYHVLFVTSESHAKNNHLILADDKKNFFTIREK